MRRTKNKNRGPEEPRRPRGRRAPIIELDQVTKVYPGGHMALDRVNLAVAAASSSSSSAPPAAASRP